MAVLHEISLNWIPPALTAQSDDRFARETQVIVNLSTSVSIFNSYISLCMYFQYLYRALLQLCETIYIFLCRFTPVYKKVRGIV